MDVITHYHAGVHGYKCAEDFIKDGNVIFDEDVFLKRYGDGISRSCKLQLNSPSLIEEGEIYPVLYKNQVYLLDDELELLLSLLYLLLLL